MGFDNDPVGSGSSTALHGQAETSPGCPNCSGDGGKRLELLKEIVPKLSRVAVLGIRHDQAMHAVKEELELAARAFRVQLQYLDVLSLKEFETHSKPQVGSALAQSLCWQALSWLLSERRSSNLAAKNRLPAIYSQIDFVEAGGLMTYGAEPSTTCRRAATYVDKILKGAKPADLPVEQPKKFEFIVNLKAAKQIGLTIPPNVLARADRVIK